MNDHFTEDQIRIMQEEIHRQLVPFERRLFMWTTVVVSFVVLLAALGLVGYQHNQDEVIANAKAVALQRSSVNHELAEQAKVQAQTSAINAYAACRRQQESAVNLGILISVAIPRHAPHRTASQKASVREFYRVVEARHVLSIPKCSKPPKHQNG